MGESTGELAGGECALPGGEDLEDMTTCRMRESREHRVDVFEIPKTSRWLVAA